MVTARAPGARRGAMIGRRPGVSTPLARASIPPESVLREHGAQRAAPGVVRLRVEQLLDAYQLVVLGDAIGARQAARLDLATARRHGD